jgi:hypothetical protein
VVCQRRHTEQKVRVELACLLLHSSQQHVCGCRGTLNSNWVRGNASAGAAGPVR